MLDFNDVNIAGPEIAHSEREMERRLRSYQQQLNDYVSQFWRSDTGQSQGGGESGALENAYFEAISLMAPRLVQNLPVVDVKSKVPGPAKAVAIAEKHAVNRWIRDSSFRQRVVESFLDFKFNVSINHLSVNDNPLLGGDRHELMPQWPELNRIPQEDFIIDFRAKGPSLVRYVGHKVLVDREDALELARAENGEDPDAGWDIAALEGVPITDDKDARDQSEQPPEREMLCLIEVWVPGYEDEDHPGAGEGYYGSVFTYARPSSDKEARTLTMVRKPYAYFGGPEGPYYWGSEYPVPNDPLGVSALVANEGQIRDMNVHARANSKNARRAKNLTFVDDTDPDLADDIANSENDTVLAVPDFDKNRVATIPIGGTNPDSMNYFMFTKDRVDRGLGISQAMRGMTSGGDVKATDVALAQSGGDIRVAWQQQQFIDYLERILRGVARIFYVHDDVRITLPEEANREMMQAALDAGIRQEDAAAMFPQDQPLEMIGDQKTAQGFADLELTIEVYSMSHTSEMQQMQRRQMAAEYVAMKAAAAITQPWINHREDIRRFGEAIQLEGLEQTWDQEVYEKIVAMQLQQQVDQPQREDTGEPKFSSAAQGPRGLSQPAGGSPSPQYDTAQGGLAGRSTGAQAGGQSRANVAGGI